MLFDIIPLKEMPYLKFMLDPLAVPEELKKYKSPT